MIEKAVVVNDIGIVCVYVLELHVDNSIFRSFSHTPNMLYTTAYLPVYSLHMYYTFICNAYKWRWNETRSNEYNAWAWKPFRY